MTLATGTPATAAARQAGPPTGAVLIRGGWIFDATGDAVRRNPGIRVRAGKLFDMQAGARSGLWTDLMKPVVAKLTEEDLIDISAYTASLAP